MALVRDIAPSREGDGHFNTLVVGGIEVVVPLEIDLDADPGKKDSLRLRSAAGDYQSVLQTGDPSVVPELKEWDKPLLLFRFPCVSVGMYCIDILIGYKWYTVLEGLRVAADGLYLGEDGTFRWEEEGGAKPLPPIPGGKDIIRESYWTRRLARARVACAAAEHPGGDAWLRRLYVLCAPPALPRNFRGDGGIPVPGFSLYQTDDDGYLSALKDDVDPSASEPSVPLFVRTKYHFFFVRFPCARDPDGKHDGEWYPEAIHERITSEEFLGAGDAFPGKCESAFGMKPLFSEVEARSDAAPSGGTRQGRSVGGGGGKKRLPHAVVSIPESPQSFIPRGSDAYGGWLLFRGMPGGTIYNVREKSDVAQCREISKQVVNLQHHLGAFRYPVGNQWCPYIPSPPASLERGAAEVGDRIPTVGKGDLYSNEGLIDVATWNGIIAFQRDGMATNVTRPCVRLTSAVLKGKHRGLLRDIGRYGTRADYTKKIMEEVGQSVDYVGGVSAASPCRGKPFYPSVVDKETGDAIRLWLNEGFRKPGAILVNLARERDGNFIPYSQWMRDDLVGPVTDVQNRLKALNFTKGFRNVGIFRDARQDVLAAPKGRIVTSIHKTGFAFDLLMDSFRWGFPDYPLHFSLDTDRSDRQKRKVYWTVFAEMDRSSMNPGRRVEYLDSIEAWSYDELHEDGGKPETRAFPGKVFLNLTRILEDNGIHPIPAYKKGWSAERDRNFILSDGKAFREFVRTLCSLFDEKNKEVLQKHRKWDGYWKILAEKKVTINAQSTHVVLAVRELEAAKDYLGVWLELFGSLNPKPEVVVYAGKKKGSDLLKKLKSRLPDQEVRIKILGARPWYVNPEWIGDGKPIRRIGPETPTFEDETLQCSLENVTDADLVIKDLDELPNYQTFVLTPLVPCGGTKVPLIGNSSVSFELVPGTPICMEWWHFQFNAGFKDAHWVSLLNDIGWTEEGLLAEKENQTIFGEGGLGYSKATLGTHAA